MTGLGSKDVAAKAMVRIQSNMLANPPVHFLMDANTGTSRKDGM